MKGIKKTLCVILYLILAFSSIYAKKKKIKITEPKINEPENITLFRKAYPDILFDCIFDSELNDWKITVSKNEKSLELYWADSKFLPEEKLADKDLYQPLLYNYTKEIPDPQNFSAEDITRIKDFSNPKNRLNSKGAPLYLFNFIYDTDTRISTESHIKKISFLGKNTNVHERIIDPLKTIENELNELAKNDSEVKSFILKLQSADSYSWRNISDSGNKSIHSFGIALDVLPVGWQKKNLYWAWRRDIDPENWMLLALEKRWMPPLRVIKTFEKHGFIWGGKWVIWDNMHFEYKPEIVLFNGIN